MKIVKREDGLFWPDNDTDACYLWTHTELYTVGEIVASLNSHRTIIHAGGNVGAYTLEFAKSFNNVYVFEPNFANFTCLCMNTKDQENVFPFRAGLGNKPMQVSMTNDTPTNCGTFRVSDYGNIPILTIDSLGLSDVDCIHLDVEGYEMSAIFGAVETIKRCKPLIVLEWLDHGLDYGWTKAGMVDFLVGMGYNRMKQTGSDMMFKHET